MTGLMISRSTPVEATVREGRVVEAYAAVFESPAEIADVEGHYREVIDRAAFNRAIDHARPQGNRREWLTSVFYNHGLTIHGDSAPEFSVPLGRTLHVEADSTGVLTRTEYAETRLANDILELIRAGAIRAQSFTGRLIRSSPPLTAGGRYRPRPDGTLPTVRRLELGLAEYGPTPIPAYDAAAVVGVRSALLTALAGADPATLRALLDPTSVAAGEPGEQEPDPVVEESGTGSHEPPAGDTPHEQEPAEEPAPVHVARTATEWSTRMRAALRARGIT